MKQIIIMTALALVLAACGKTNTASSGTTTFTNTATSDTTSISTTDFTTFKSLVKNNRFVGQGYTDVKFYGYKQAYSTETETKKFLGIPVQFTTGSTGKTESMSREYNSSTGVVTHESGASISALVSYMGTLVDGATSYTACQRAGCFVVLKDGIYYTIDLYWPIAANPVYMYKQSTGEVVGITGRFSVIQQ